MQSRPQRRSSRQLFQRRAFGALTSRRLFNDRQRDMLTRLLDGQEGEITAATWARSTICSRDTALRDIAALIDHGILVRNPGGGRRSSYRLADT